MGNSESNESKLKKFEIPFIILFVLIVLFLFLVFRNKPAAPQQTFAPNDTYQDGKYIAGISLSDAEMDLIVEVQDHKITSVSLEGLDEKTSVLYKDLAYGIDYVNTYVTATQSLELPQNTNTSATTTMLMDAVKVALSNDKDTQISSTYKNVYLDSAKAAQDSKLDRLNEATSNKQADADSATKKADNPEAEKKANTEASPHTSLIEEDVIEQ